MRTADFSFAYCICSTVGRYQWLSAALLAFSICEMLNMGELAFPALIDTQIDCFSLVVSEDCYGSEMSKTGADI